MRCITKDILDIAAAKANNDTFRIGKICCPPMKYGLTLFILVTNFGHVFPEGRLDLDRRQPDFFVAEVNVWQISLPQARLTWTANAACQLVLFLWLRHFSTANFQKKKSAL